MSSHLSKPGKQTLSENTSSLQTENMPGLQTKNTAPSEVPCNHYALNAAMEERRAEPTINAAQRKTYSMQD